VSAEKESGAYTHMRNLLGNVNRARVLALWVVFAAERLRCEENPALTLGRALRTHEAEQKAELPDREESAEKVEFVRLMRGSVPGMRSRRGSLAVDKGRPTDRVDVWGSLEREFGDGPEAVQGAT